MKIKITPEFLADLKAKAEKATPGSWEAIACIVALPEQNNEQAILGGFFDYDDVENNRFSLGHANAAFIATANPQVVLALIGRLENLELMSRQWRTKFKDRGVELHIKRNLFQKNKKRMMRLEKQICKLEKEADWLAENARAQWCYCTCPFPDHMGETKYCVKCWREAARKAVEGKNGSD